MRKASLIESRVFKGDRSGPSLLIIAGVHGDEYLPMLAVSELIRQFDSSVDLQRELRGTLTLIPIANASATRQGKRAGEDGMDLARTFPGRSDGSVTERVADALSREIAQAEFLIDLHTGGTQYCVFPLSGYMLHRDQTVLDQQRAIANAFQLPFVWGTSDRLDGRSLSVARDANVPAIYVEYLGGHRERSEISHCADLIRADHPLVVGCLSVMRHLGMLPTNDSSNAMQRQKIYEDWRAESGHMQICNPAPASGYLIPRVQLGQLICKGTRLAEIRSEIDHRWVEVFSQQEGRVVAIRDSPRVNLGDAVAVIAERHEKT